MRLSVEKGKGMRGRYGSTECELEKRKRKERCFYRECEGEGNSSTSKQDGQKERREGRGGGAREQIVGLGVWPGAETGFRSLALGQASGCPLEELLRPRLQNEDWDDRCLDESDLWLSSAYLSGRFDRSTGSKGASARRPESEAGGGG